jgi:hypothetical protein
MWPVFDAEKACRKLIREIKNLSILLKSFLE